LSAVLTHKLINTEISDEINGKNWNKPEVIPVIEFLSNILEVLLLLRTKFYALIKFSFDKK
jgi:hypothetical protein